MLMVLNLHSFSGYTHGDGILQALDFLRESTSICAVDTFILISGYFGIKWRKKSIFNLLFQVLFYSFVVYGVCVVAGVFQFEKGTFLQCFKAFYDSWGFITWYIILYFVSPWLNAFSEKTGSKNLLAFIFVFWFAEWLIMRSFGALNFCLIYLIGRWISKEGIEKFSSKAVGGYIFMTIIIFLCSYISYLFLHFNASQMGDFVFGYSYASPFVILQAVSLFLIFGKLEIQSRVINWCAASCLSIFLIHMHPAIKQIGYYNYTENLYDKSLWEHTTMLIILIFTVFFGSIFMDKIRIFVSDITYNIFKWINKKCIKKEFILNIIGVR